MQRTWTVVVSILALMVALVAIRTVADEPATSRPLKVEDYLDWEQVSDPRISPDGSQVIYNRQWVNKLADRWESELWIVRSDGTKNRRLAKGSMARWSPDGTRIAYLAAGGGDTAQVFVRWMDAESATSQVTRVTHAPSHIEWSPDGSRIAFTMRVDEKPKWKIDMPTPPKGAKWTEAPRIVEKSHYRQDRRGFFQAGYEHLFVVPADGGTPRQLTSGSWHVGARPTGLRGGAGMDWTPDGREIVIDGNRDPHADRTYRQSHLYAVNVSTGAIRQITHEKGPWSSPHVSPDGRQIAFVGYPWTPQTYKTTEVYVINMDGSARRQISGDLNRDAAQLHWAHDGEGVYFTVGSHGTRNVYYAPLEGEVEQITRGTHMLSLDSINESGIAVGVRSASQHPADIVSFPLASPDDRQFLTRVNADILSHRRLGEVEELWYESGDGTKLQGWIVKPPDFDVTRSYPLILHIHGGPHGMYSVRFEFSFQHLAAAGYVVLYTNPRGSTGYGTQFGNAIDNSYPSVDYLDLMAGVDAVLSKGYIDPQRMYVTGVSGGGVLSSWIIGHTSRFAAAAVRSPVINWISFAGTTDITSWGFYRFRPPYWEDAQLWLRHSPIMYVKNVTTPTLLMTGELDLRTPMGQTEEYYQALRQLNVPTAMIRFHGEYHGTGSKPSNFMRTQLYLLSWFERYRHAQSGN